VFRRHTRVVIACGRSKHDRHEWPLEGSDARFRSPFSPCFARHALRSHLGANRAAQRRDRDMSQGVAEGVTTANCHGRLAGRTRKSSAHDRSIARACEGSQHLCGTAFAKKARWWAQKRDHRASVPRLYAVGDVVRGLRSMAIPALGVLRQETWNSFFFDHHRKSALLRPPKHCALLPRCDALPAP